MSRAAEEKETPTRKKRQRSDHEKKQRYEDAATGHAGIVLVDSIRYDLRKDVNPRLREARKKRGPDTRVAAFFRRRKDELGRGPYMGRRQRSQEKGEREHGPN